MYTICKSIYSRTSIIRNVDYPNTPIDIFFFIIFILFFLFFTFRLWNSGVFVKQPIFIDGSGVGGRVEQVAVEGDSAEGWVIPVKTG